MGTLPALLLISSGVMKLGKSPSVIEGFAHFGYAEKLIFGLGIVELSCAVIYLIPRTSMLGAILVTAYFGGATATCLRVGDPWWPTVVAGVLIWGGLYFRDPRIRALIPLRN